MFAEIAIGAVNTAIQTTRVQSAFQVAAARKSMDVQQLIGQAAIQLIQSASLDPDIGRHLDVSA
ncbi:MAG TPA: YjfB family protein [Candidatus Hydrogenedentes bacterium]|nr:YjfB family protein [Candidatus Hydrogenedentota bacterium]HPC15551.1 YjfB family protein [Candidatus Hydrogenedentota bacterium]HRT19371.1 YjfB family protein [Candidatus Hydrogenedentota bacterium]HRT63895.1 YjfB family protein [Candidatus Hydrogenedentota bacterium]